MDIEKTNLGGVVKVIKTAILQLNKQHPIKDYMHSPKGQYSCWGNYDSMSIQLVDPQPNTLIVSRDTLGLTDMWYQLTTMLGNQDGSYSQQCIGLIYEGKDDDTLKSFLEPDEYFCCACLLKLKDSYQSDIYISLKALSKESFDNACYVKSIFFRTMDNADAVFLIKGNSYKKIMDLVIEISKSRTEILYTYSICGVNQNYIQNDTWEKAKHPLVNDKIQQITNRIIAKPAVDIEKLKARFGGNGEWTWVLGNTDILWNLNTQEQTIDQAINLMRIYTNHQTELSALSINSNFLPVYDNEIYGVTTEIITNYNKYKFEKSSTSSSSPPVTPETHWCRARIQMLKKQLQKSRDEKNDMLYSYYLALIQSLTMIAPYEESSFAKDIFYIIFPSLLMFHKQLDEALNEEQNTRQTKKANKRWEILIKNLTNYLDMLDQIIYRSIHSEQTFFMVPGYCGVLYTILPKLSMMYMAFLYAGIEILQNETNLYECCLYPMVDSKPCTTEIDFHLQPTERLIEIKVSQRSMFVANLMPILLLHELSHYVGTSRERTYRVYCMIQPWSELLVKILLESYDTLSSPFQKECMQLIYEKNRVDVREYIAAELVVRMEKIAMQKELYFDNVFPLLVSFSAEILEDNDHMLRTKIQRKDKELKERICKNCDHKTFTGRIHELEELYNFLNMKMHSILKTKHIETIEENMKICFKETYADIIALYLIGFQNTPELFDRYLEAFYLSEGINFEVSNITLELVNRIAVTAVIMPTLDPYAEESWNKLVQNKLTKYTINPAEMNSVDYLVLYAHIYQAVMRNDDNAIKNSIWKEIEQTFPHETDESIAGLEMTWVGQMSYFNKVVNALLKADSNIEQSARPQAHEKCNSRKEAKERIRNLYTLLNYPSHSVTNGLEAFDDIIHWYKQVVDKKKIII